MFSDNTKTVNRTIAISLAWSSLLWVALITCKLTGIFNFDRMLMAVILVVGPISTLSPFILWKFKVPDEFLKYYILASISITIGLLGTNNGIGIYITYALVPILSCLYFDRKFTLRICIFSYVTMAIGVYFNTGGKLEVKYLNWSHWVTFRNYMIGFTLEYVIVMLFLYQIARRTQKFLEEQQKNLLALTDENELQKKVSSLYQNTMSKQRMTAFKELSLNISELTPACYANFSAGHHFTVKLQDMLMYSENFEETIDKALSMVGEYFGLDRIMYISIYRSSGFSKLSFQWNRDPMDTINDYYPNIPKNTYDDIVSYYDATGYFTFSKTAECEATIKKDMPSEYVSYMFEKLLGEELWIPIVSSGEYKGAIAFDKYDMTPYSYVDRYLLTEVVSIISTHVIRYNADNANYAKSNFLSTMSHEIRTPMNAILGMTTVALREDMNDNVRDCLHVIKSSSEGLLTIINDILDFSKIESGKLDIIPAEYHTASLINDIKILAETRNTEKGLDLIIDYSQNLPASLIGDSVRVKQIMINLVTNAIKYTDSGSVTISISHEMDSDETCLFKFSVTDTGQGIRTEDIPKLFAAFTQVNQEKNHHTEGTGLGLKISKQLVELMDGEIHVESEFGKGSTFSFELPQKISDATPIGDIEKRIHNQHTGSKDTKFTAPGAKILIVDDNEMNLMIEEALFEPLLMDITTAQSGKETLELLKTNTYDLIFLDHFMPEMDGIDTAIAIRRLEGNPNQSVPIVALTADAVSGVKEKMLASGMNDYLSKPVDMKAVIRVLKKFLPKELQKRG